MTRLLILLPLMFFHMTSFGAIYKCDQNGKIEYQEVPCKPNSTSTELKQSQVNIANVKQSSERKISLHFPHIPLKTALQVIADYSGNQLVAEPSVNGLGAFFYSELPWDIVLKDIALKHQLIVLVQNGNIYVSKKETLQNINSEPKKAILKKKKPKSVTGGREDGSDASRCALAKDILNGSLRHSNGAPVDDYDIKTAKNDVRKFCK